MLVTVEVVRKNGAFTTKDEYPFCGKNLEEIRSKLDTRIKNEGGLIDRLPFNSINLVLDGVVMDSRYESQTW
jgi:hypothetical protein